MQCAALHKGVESATTGTGRKGGREGSGLVPRPSDVPVGSAKFGPRVGTRVGGLVSPRLVGAGVPVGTGVGAATTYRARGAAQHSRIDFGARTSALLFSRARL
jgi:hypothetical protein